MEVYRQYYLQRYRICLNLKNEISSQHFVFCGKLGGERRIWPQQSICQFVRTQLSLPSLPTKWWSLLHVLSTTGYIWFFFLKLSSLHPLCTTFTEHKHYCYIKKLWYKKNHLEIIDIGELSWLIVTFLFCFPPIAEKSLSYPEHPVKHRALITLTGNNKVLGSPTLLAQKNSSPKVKKKE